MAGMFKVLGVCLFLLSGQVESIDIRSTSSNHFDNRHPTATPDQTADIDLRSIVTSLIQRIDFLETKHQHELEDMTRYIRQLEGRIHHLEDTQLETHKTDTQNTVQKSGGTNNILLDTNKSSAADVGYEWTDKEARAVTRESNGTVAFNAYLSSRLVNPGTHQTIRFDHIVTNIGNTYNAYTGVFTCNIAGVYVFFWTISNDNDDWCKTELIRNGVAYGQTTSGNNIGFDLDTSGSSMVILPMDQGDVVWIRVHSDHDMGSDYIEPICTSFSGFLLG